MLSREAQSFLTAPTRTGPESAIQRGADSLDSSNYKSERTNLLVLVLRITS